MSLDSEGGSLRLARHTAWKSQIAYFGEGKCFVEVHHLVASAKWAPEERKAWVDRLEPLMGVRCRVLPRLLGVGETETGVYALTPVQMGEGLSAFVARVGPLVPGATFALTLQLLEDLLRLPEQKDWVKFADLNTVLFQQVAGGRLQLAVSCLGGGANSPACGDMPSPTELVEQVCRLIFVMLVGRGPNGEKLDQHPVLTKLPSALRLTLRAALQGGDQAATTLSALRDQVREALFAFVGQQGARSPQKLLANIEDLQPENEVGRLLFGSAPVTELLGNRFSLAENHAESALFEGLASIQNCDGERVTIHLLPPQRLIGERLEGAVSVGSWKFNAQDTPNLLQPLCVWERPDWGYLAEKREFGIDLDRLLSERGVLNPAEVLVLSQQIRDGIAQAKACGVETLSLHPSEIFLKVGKPGVMMQREMERLMERRIDAWPAFTVKLRTHLTTRRFLVIPEEISGKTDSSSNADLLILMIFLLNGESPSGREDLQLAETLPDALRTLLDRHWQIMARGENWDIDTFFQAFSSAISVEEGATDLAEKLRGPAVNPDEMESAGSVSDFDNPWTEDAADDEPQSSWEVGTTTLLSKKKHKARWFFFVIPILLITSLLWLLWPTNSTSVSTPQENLIKEAPSGDVVRRAVLPSQEEIQRASREKSAEVRSKPVSMTPDKENHTKINQGHLVEHRLGKAIPRP